MGLRSQDCQEELDTAQKIVPSSASQHEQAAHSKNSVSGQPSPLGQLVCSGETLPKLQPQESLRLSFARAEGPTARVATTTDATARATNTAEHTLQIRANMDLSLLALLGACGTGTPRQHSPTHDGSSTHRPTALHGWVADGRSPLTSPEIASSNSR